MGASRMSGPLFVGGVPIFGNAPASYFGTQWFVNTVSGADGNDGRSPQTPFATMGRAFYTDATLTAGEGTTSNLGPNDTIWFVGKVREQLIAPLTTPAGLAVTGVQIVGMAQGNVRDDDGAKWYTPAAPTAGMALLNLRQQGWVLRNFLMTPDTTSGACVKATRAESATYPDSSHFIMDGMRFVGTSLTTTYGVQDVGGNHHYIIRNCEFQTLTTAIYCSSTSIAVPLRNLIQGNTFLANTNDISSSLSYSRIVGNQFMSDNTVKISTVANAGQGASNTVVWNTFPNIAADIDPAHGYDGATTDTWTSNSAADAVVFGDPA